MSEQSRQKLEQAKASTEAYDLEAAKRRIALLVLEFVR